MDWLVRHPESELLTVLGIDSDSIFGDIRAKDIMS